MQGAAGYGNLRHRFPPAALSASGSLGMISTGRHAQYPRLLFSFIQSLRQAQRPLFLLYQTHLIEPLPALAGKVNLTVLRIVGDSVQHIRVSVTQRLGQ